MRRKTKANSYDRPTISRFRGGAIHLPSPILVSTGVFSIFLLIGGGVYLSMTLRQHVPQRESSSHSIQTTPAVQQKQQEAPSSTTNYPTSTPIPTPTEALAGRALLDRMVRLARKDLAWYLKIDPSEIQILRIEEVFWPDTCVGLPKTNRCGVPVKQPGHRITFRAFGQKYYYHILGEFMNYAGPGLEPTPLFPRTRRPTL